MSNYRLSGFSVLPPVIKNLMLINALLFLITYSVQAKFHYNLNHLLGLYYPSSVYFKPFQFITHIFMHADLGHLLSNMFSLWVYGSILENYWGGKRFFIYYMITAFGAALLQTGFNAVEIYKLQDAIAAYTNNPGMDSFIKLTDKTIPGYYVADFLTEWQQHPTDPAYLQGSVEIVNDLALRKINGVTVGASGAVFGLMLGAALLFPNTIVFPLFIPLKYIAIIHGCRELYYGFINSPEDYTAHFAHLGGMLFGFILIKIWNKTRRDTFY